MSSFRNILVIVAIPIALLVPVLLVKLAVSDKDPTLPTEHLRHYEVVVDEYYGVRLDQKAHPRDVAYVLLKAIEENFAAAEAPGRVQQLEGVRRAREIQIACAAPEGILRDYESKGLTLDEKTSELNKQKLILKAILPWAQKLGYYVGALKLDDRDTWHVSTQEASDDRPAMATVRFRTDKDDSKVQVSVHLTKEKDLWRVYRVDVDPIVAKLKLTPDAAQTQPSATRPATAPKTPPAKAPEKPAPKPVAEKQAPTKPAPKTTPAKPAPAAKTPKKQPPKPTPEPKKPAAEATKKPTPKPAPSTKSADKPAPKAAPAPGKPTTASKPAGQ